MKEKNKSENFSVAVIATMSSGKSTTLNAMLGVPLLPSKNEACTATVCEIEDIDGMEDFKARAIKTNGETTEWENIQCEDRKLSEWNNAEVETIEIQGDFPHIDNYKDKIKFYDTPGPNNSTDKTHSKITNNILSSSDYGFIVCVMNASQFGVTGERKLLEDIKTNIKKKYLETKIVFAVNKINDLDLERENLDELIVNIEKYLSDEIGFKSPTIIPVNSLLSLNIRKIINSHKNNKPLEFSFRKQKQLCREIEYYQEFKGKYSYAISSTLKKAKHSESIFDNVMKQERGVNRNDKICLGKKEITLGNLIDVDYLTGIPYLEEMLEIELKNNDSYLNNIVDIYNQPIGQSYRKPKKKKRRKR